MTEYFQDIRSKLQKRFYKLKSATYITYNLTLAEFIDFVSETPPLKELYERLLLIGKEYEEPTKKIIEEATRGLRSYPTQGTEEERASFSLVLIKNIFESKYDNIEASIGFLFYGGSDYEFINGCNAFTDNIVERIYDYLDEKIEDKNLELYYLIRYKHKCEWFNRKALLNLWENNTQKGEDLLSMNLYEYLYEQGLEFYIEPSSSSGEIDFIQNQVGKNRILADVKIYNPEKSKDKPYIKNAFRQIYDYTKDYNSQFGYLIIFKTCSDDLKLNFTHKISGVPYIPINGKNIFFIVIDIFNYETSASKRGTLNVTEIPEDYLIKVLETDS